MRWWWLGPGGCGGGLVRCVCSLKVELMVIAVVLDVGYTIKKEEESTMALEFWLLAAGKEGFYLLSCTTFEEEQV